MAALLDSNLILRFAEPGYAMFAPAAEAIRKLRVRSDTIYMCPQNHAEFWAVATRPVTANGLGMTPTQADAELSRMEALFPLLPDTPTVLPAWRRLVGGAGVSGKQVHDARLLAILSLYGIGQLLTFNTQDFVRCAALVSGVLITDPQTV